MFLPELALDQDHPTYASHVAGIIPCLVCLLGWGLTNFLPRLSSNCLCILSNWNYRCEHWALASILFFTLTSRTCLSLKEYTVLSRLWRWHTYIPSTQKTKGKGSQIPGQPGLHGKTMSQKRTNKKFCVCVNMVLFTLYSIMSPSILGSAFSTDQVLCQVTQCLNTSESQYVNNVT
jgi:hypothetical protein